MLRTAARQRGFRVLLLLVLASVLVGGCSPDAFLVTDEDRERNFLRAKDAERLRDYEAAAEFYERALEKNPRSSVAHLGYATLCEAQLRRYAEAVYHYQRFLRLKPDDPKADGIRSRVTNCTERLATSVPLVIRSETIARDLEAVRRENLSLRAEVTNLLAFSTTWSNEVRRLSAALAAAGAPSASVAAGMPAAGGGDFRIGGREGEAGAGSAIGRGHEGGGTGPDPFWRWNDLVNGRQCRDAIHGLGLSQVDAEFEFIGHEFPGAPGDVGRHHGADCAPIWGEPGRVAASQSRIGRAANATRHVCADPGALGTAMGSCNRMSWAAGFTTIAHRRIEKARVALTLAGFVVQRPKGLGRQRPRTR